jgi:hypothetical protein
MFLALFLFKLVALVSLDTETLCAIGVLFHDFFFVFLRGFSAVLS